MLHRTCSVFQLLILILLVARLFYLTFGLSPSVGASAASRIPQNNNTDNRNMDDDIFEYAISGSGGYQSSLLDQTFLEYSDLTTEAPYSNQQIFNVCNSHKIFLPTYSQSTVTAQVDPFLNCTFALKLIPQGVLEIKIIRGGHPRYVVLQDLSPTDLQSWSVVDISYMNHLALRCNSYQIGFFVRTQSKVRLSFRWSKLNKTCSVRNVTNDIHGTHFDSMGLCNITRSRGGYNRSTCLLKCPDGCTCHLKYRQYHLCPRIEKSQRAFLAIPFETQLLSVDNQQIHILQEKSFRDLTSLIYLSIDNVQLHEIKPSAFVGLKNLRRMFLRNNMIKSFVPGVFEGLDMLSRLYVSGNRLLTIASRYFGNMPNLKYLILSDNSIKNISEGAFIGMNKLFKLDLSNNSLNMLQPRMFNGLSNLSIISLNENQLESIPSNVFTDSDMPHIKRISVFKNRLKNVSATAFNGLEELFEIRLNDNELSHLSEEVLSDQRKLHFLKLQNNKLTNLSSNIWGYGTLLDVNLSGNKLSNLSCSMFRRLIKLFVMDIEHNGIVQVSACVFEGMYNIKVLKAGHNSIDSKTINGRAFKLIATSLENLGLGFNEIKAILPGAFKNLKRLKFLDLRNNQILILETGAFEGMEKLEELYLDNNLLKEFNANVFQDTRNLKLLTMKMNNLKYLKNSNLPGLEKITSLFLNNNSIDQMDPGFFTRFNILEFVDLTGNSLIDINDRSFIGLRDTAQILVDSHGVCCSIPNGNCTASTRRHPFFTCGALLPHIVLDIFMWILGFMAIAGNLGVLLWRITHKTRRQKVQWLLIMNLAVADFLMGIYMIIIAAADNVYGIYFPLHSDNWRDSHACKIAGFLTVVSSEASVFFITFISIDRLFGIEFPFNPIRPGIKRATLGVIAMWIIAISIGAATSVFGGSIPDFYDMSDLCIGLPFVKKPNYATETINITSGNWDPSQETFKGASRNTDSVTSSASLESQSGSSVGMFFSITVFLGINFVCFIIISVCYSWIFIAVKISTKKSGRRPEREEEVKMALKMAVIVGTDFCCWIPIIILGLVVQVSDHVTIPPEVIPWIVVFVLPVNSSVNPFLYNFKFLAIFRCIRSRYVMLLSRGSESSKGRPSTKASSI